MNPPADSARDYDQEHRDTDERRYAYDFDQTIREYMLATFGPFLRDARKGLELGCYRGDFTLLLKPLIPDLTVVEASGELVAEARSRVGDSIRFIESRFEDLTLSPEYDAIFLLHTLEHLDDPGTTLDRIGGWLAPEGRLFVAVPNANAPSRQIAVRMGLIEHNSAVTSGERAQGHRRTYSLDTLVREVKKARLRLEHHGGVLFKPLANYQFDQALERGIVTPEFVHGCFELGATYPDLCASIYAICRR